MADIDWVGESQQIARDILEKPVHTILERDIRRLAKEFIVQTMPNDELRAILCKMYRQHRGIVGATMLSDDRRVIFEYFEEIGVWSDEMRDKAMEDHR